MVNFELSVHNLKQRIKGIKLPGSLEELRHTVDYGKTTVEVPISGIPNSAVVLEVLGKSETPKLVLENGEEVDILEDGSVNVVKKEETKEDKEKKEDKAVTPPVASETNVVGTSHTNEVHGDTTTDHLGDTTHTEVETSSETVSPGATSPVAEVHTGLVTGTEAGSL